MRTRKFTLSAFMWADDFWSFGEGEMVFSEEELLDKASIGEGSLIFDYLPENIIQFQASAETDPKGSLRLVLSSGLDDYNRLILLATEKDQSIFGGIISIKDAPAPFLDINIIATDSGNPSDDFIAPLVAIRFPISKTKVNRPSKDPSILN